MDVHTDNSDTSCNSPSHADILYFLGVNYNTVIHINTYVRPSVRRLLTYSMVQNPSLAANWFAASQEIPHISSNPNVLYRTHKRPPPVSILGQPNPVL